MKIIAKTLAGLANKLRVIESAVSLAKDLDYPLEVVWVPDFQMVAHYRELFETSELFDVVDYDKYKYCRSSFSIGSYKKPISKLINLSYGIDMVFNELDIFQQVRPGLWDIQSLAKGKTTYIDTCHDFYSYRYNFSWARPIPLIAEAVTDFESKMDHHKCIGLHIRRTDNISSIENSPDYLFESAIREEIEKDPSAVFLLATDDSKTQLHFINIFGNDRILAHPKKFGRDTVAATQDALIDWLLLSKCKKLYCSFFSSFSETAAAVSNAPTTTLKKK
jgi:hypothetical protein